MSLLAKSLEIINVLRINGDLPKNVMRKEDKKHKLVILKVTFIVIVTYETMTPKVSDRIKMEEKANNVV